MPKMHPDYFKAKRMLNEFVDAYPELGLRSSAWCVEIGRSWDEALAKDEDGRQCLRFVEGFIECLTPMRV